MRKLGFVTTLVILLALPHLALAVSLTSLNADTDCDGWSADVDITVRDGAIMGRLEYAVDLYDASGTVVESFTYGEMLDLAGGPVLVVPVGGSWSAPLDGEYTVEGSFTVYDAFPDGQNLTYGSFTTPLACGSAVGGEVPEGDPCTYSARHWSTNPDLWPVASLNVGGRDMTQAELLDMLEMSGPGMPMFLLMREVIAAKLNLANGASDDIQANLDAADDFVAGHWGAQRAEAGKSQREVMQLKNGLFAYNRRGCPDMPTDLGTGVGFSARGLTTEPDKAAVEFMSLGAVKALYR